MNQKYDVIAEQENYTVMGCYTPLPKENTGYQSEAQLESSFIKQLVELGYTYADIKTEKQMIANLRQQMNRLNKVELTDSRHRGDNQIFTLNEQLCLPLGAHL